MAQFLISDTSPPGSATTFPIAEGAKGIDASIMQDAETHDLPGGGTVWYMSVQPDGPLHGSVQFNRDEFEASTVQGWTAGLKRIPGQRRPRPQPELEAPITPAHPAWPAPEVPATQGEHSGRWTRYVRINQAADASLSMYSFFEPEEAK